MIINAIDKAFSDFPSSNTVDATDLFLVSKEVGEAHDTVKLNARTLINSANNQFEMASLDTNDKTIVGAINELADARVNLLKVNPSLGETGSNTETIIGRCIYYHLAFTTLNDLPANTILFEGSIHNSSPDNVGFASLQGRATTLRFDAIGHIVTTLPIPKGETFFIDTIVI